ncbi:C-type lectin domain family 10 member A-like [Chanodichthys erythropterus]|uniref:C-type lectin domain family 10 member A-like n=1 Tax=Chanodichthys erythropterus TaxID=933992 RepID=UPI00351F4406
MESEDRIEKTADIYVSAEAVRDMKHKKDIEDFDTQTSKSQTPQHTVIVLSVHIHTKSTNYTEERDQLLNKISNITEERDQLTSKNENLTNARVQLIFKNKNLTNERDLRNELQICAGWNFYQSSLYYISNKTKNWTESRRYCTERGADLIIINNTEEQEFVKNVSGAAVVWIGLTDSDVEGTWKWVDGSNMTSGFWANKEPGGGRAENCVVTVAVPISKDWQDLVGWHDAACNKAYQWICEKRIVQLLLP